MSETKILEALTSLEEVKKGLAFVKEDEAYSIEEQIDLTCIEAPTGHEENKAKAILEKFEALGLEDVHMDGIKNAIGVLKGTEGKKTILIEAHMDTVFPLGTVTERPVIGEDNVIHCPGICDNTRGCTAVLAVLRAIKASGIKPKNNIIFAGTAQEEGCGSLGGMKYLLKEHPEITADISIDGGWFTNITFNATGIKTLRYTFHGKSGHSFGHYGKIAITTHALGRAIAKISDITLPAEPRSCCTVTSVSGGTIEGLHAMPEAVSFIVNYRSNSAEQLVEIENMVEKAVKDACAEENAKWNVEEITYTSEVLCDAPAGSQEADTPLVRAFQSVVRYMGEEPTLGQGGCCNSNVPVGLGIPAVCMGGGSDFDSHVHSLAECHCVTDTYKLNQAAYLLLLLAAGTETTASIFE